MRIGRVGTVGVGLVLVCALGRTSQPMTQTPLVTAVFRNWTAWDRDHNDQLSLEEIDAAVLDRSVSGDDAAAAGTLKLIVRRAEMKDIALTRDYFQTYSRQRLAKGALLTDEAAELETVDILNQERTTAKRGSTSPPDWDLYFSASRHRIARGAGGWTGRFELDHLRQGPLSDCFFLSSLGSLLMQRPKQLTSLLTPLADGTFQANFPGQAPFIVRPPTDAELAISSVSAGDGYWLPVMEEAFGQYRMMKKGIEDDVEATDSISHGGRTGPTIDALTGHSHKSITLAPSAERRKAAAGKVLPQLRAELLAAIRDRRVMTVSVISPAVDAGGRITEGTDHGTAPHIPPGITRHHAYAILSYDRSSDVIRLWNPHGQNFTPKGIAGLEFGYPTEHGRFTLPLTEAYSFCANFTFEIPKLPRTK
jgi:hypothetical protein